MPRVYQVFSAVVLVASLILVWCTLAVRFAHHQERAGLRNNDGKPFVSNAQHSRTGHNYSHPNSPPRHKNYRRDTPLTPLTRKIAAIGDLHADYARTLSILTKAGVVGHDTKWTGRYDLLVQVGDIVDRGPDAISLFVYMEDLRLQAQAVGGNVLSLLGNHELWAMMGDGRISRPDLGDFDFFGSAKDRRKEFTKGTIGKWLKDHYRIALRIPFQAPLNSPNTPYDPNDKSRFSHSAISFVHGGLAPDNPFLTPFPTKLNKLGNDTWEALQKETRPPDNPLWLIGNEKSSPVWYRGWATLEENVICPRVDEVLQKTGTKRMVMGHTPGKEIKQRCGGKVYVIDTGISSAFIARGGIPSLLSIEYTLNPVSESHDDPDDPDDPCQLWKETEVLTAIYVGREDVELWREENTISTGRSGLLQLLASLRC